VRPYGVAPTLAWFRFIDIHLRPKRGRRKRSE